MFPLHDFLSHDAFGSVYILHKLRNPSVLANLGEVNCSNLEHIYYYHLHSFN